MNSPEKIWGRICGCDLTSLQELTVALAKECYFGTDHLVQCSKSGQNSVKLDPDTLIMIKNHVHSRVQKQMSQAKFELVWDKCMLSLSKACQTLWAKAKKMTLSSD